MPSTFIERFQEAKVPLVLLLNLRSRNSLQSKRSLDDRFSFEVASEGVHYRLPHSNIGWITSCNFLASFQKNTINHGPTRVSFWSNFFIRYWRESCRIDGLCLTTWLIRILVYQTQKGNSRKERTWYFYAKKLPGFRARYRSPLWRRWGVTRYLS